MDALELYESDARAFWLAWQQVPDAEKTRCKDDPTYRSALAHTLTIRHALMRPLLRGPPHMRTYSAAQVPEHPLTDGGSDDE